IIDLFHRTVVGNLVGIDREGIGRDVQHAVARQPVLAAGRDVILLGGQQLIELGAGSRVRRHVEDAFGIGQFVAFGFLNRVALVAVYKRLFGSFAFRIAFFRPEGIELTGRNVHRMIPVIVGAVFIHRHRVGIMGLAVAGQHLGTAIGVVMALQDNVNVVR